MKENIEEDITRIENILNDEKNFKKNKRGNKEIRFEINSLMYNTLKFLISDYKRVLKENEELKKKYNSLTDKIILKIDEYDYKFEKAKKQSKNDIADYYWDLIINFKKLLGGK